MEKQFNEILSKVDELVEIVENTSQYRKYRLIEEKVKSNDEIMTLISDIKKTQKVIVNKEYRKENTTLEEKHISDNLKKLNSIPLYLEFTYLKEDLNNLFQDIKNILEKSINDNINSNGNF